MQVPFVEVATVYHVGTLDPVFRDAGARGFGSQEGACLSVSLCPGAWTRIARLGGEAWWALDGMGRFVDAHAVLDDEATLGAVVAWGTDAGLCERREGWRCWRHDDETETWGFMTRDSREEALAEFDGDGEDLDGSGPDGGPAVEAFDRLVALPALEREVGGRGGACAEDLLLMAWTRHVAPGLVGAEVDGVWWRENHDPSALSAPRGAILPEAVCRWTPRSVDPWSVDDEYLLATMPETSAPLASPGR